MTRTEPMRPRGIRRLRRDVDVINRRDNPRHLAARRALRAVRQNGGVTITPDGSPPRTGCAVGDPAYTETVAYCGTVSDDALIDIMAGFMARAPYGRAVGYWRDPETDTLYLDVVDIIADVTAAIALGAERGELSVYDFDTAEVIPC